MPEHDQLYPSVTKELAEQRKSLAPKPAEAFKAFSRSVFTEGAIPAKTKQLIAVAVAHVTQCPYCIRGHTTAALEHGATAEEIMEAIWVAAEMRAGAAYAHSALALDTIAHSHHGSAVHCE
jgi:AhpD family alkylhydroperoxidase